MKDLVKGLFETHLTVKDLEKSIAFYRDSVGLELAYTVPERGAAFFWIGGRGQSNARRLGNGFKPESNPSPYRFHHYD